MRLKRIDAVRYGAMNDVSLGPLGEGLTVVVGPNEAGKSTLTALVGHVLYGFPIKSQSEKGYHPVSGERHGRLVFGDGEGDWAIQRIGRTSGTATVEAMNGPERPGLLDELTSGVTRQSFRIAFGFGLEDLAAIEHNGSADGVLSRLYAAGAGLEVNPLDVRSELEDEARSIYTPRGRTQDANRLVKDIAETRKRIHELERESLELAEEQARLGELEMRLAEERARRNSALERWRRLERDLDRYDRHAEALTEAEDRLSSERESIAGWQAEIESIVIDDAVLRSAPGLTVALEELPAFHARAEAAEQLDGEKRDLGLRIAECAPEWAAAVGIDDAAAMLDRWRDRLSAAEHWAQQTRRDAEIALAEARAAATGAEEPVEGAGRQVPLSVWMLLLFGLGIAGLGLLRRDAVAIVAGVVAAVAGGLAAFLGKGGSRVGDADRQTARVRERDEAARAKQELAGQAERALEEARTEYRDWVASLGTGVTGAELETVRACLEAARERGRLEREMASLEEKASAAQRALEAYVHKLSSAIELFTDARELPVTPTDVPACAARAKEALGAAKAADERRRELEKHVEESRRAMESAETRAAAARSGIAQIVEEWGITSSDPRVALEMLFETAKSEHSESADLNDSLAAEHAELAGRLDLAGRENELGEHRQQLEALRSRLAEAWERFAVAATAVALLDKARDRYERERQPKVVKAAQDVLDAVTDGRYSTVRIPLGEGEMRVFGEGSMPKSSEELSRGTAEQLYLSLRIGLLANLGETGKHLPVLMDDILVNFDPERKREAAKAIAHLAESRQVIVFTCHPDTADLFESVDPDAVRLSLG